MNKIFYATLSYTILGLAMGVFYRTLTHAADFTADTQLAVVHTHFLALKNGLFQPTPKGDGLSQAQLTCKQECS